MSPNVPLDDWKPTLVRGCITREAVPKDACRVCGQEIWLDTDGDGQLVAKNSLGGDRHVCPGAELGQGAIEAEMADNERTEE